MAPLLELRSVAKYFSDDFSLRDISMELRSGEVHILKDLDRSIRGRHALVVEDIVDTGLTLFKVSNLLKDREPLSLRICTLLDKPSRRKVEVPVEYVGFTIEDHFVVGYGLDLDGKLRNLPYVGVYHP